MYKLDYFFWDDWIDEEVYACESFYGDYEELRNYIDDLRRDGCYDIFADYIEEDCKN